jgi:murein DD-endopeptidase MepM/ murein hydrolase activator NlpD
MPSPWWSNLPGMRSVLSIAVAAGSLLLAAPAAAGAAGGAPAPSVSGGTEFGAPLASSRRKSVRPVARVFALTPRTVAGDGSRPSIRLRVEARGTRVSARLALLRVSDRRPAGALDLGRQPTGRTVTIPWPRSAPLPSGRFIVRLHVKDGAGRTLLRRARTSGRTTLTVRAPKPTIGGVFPVAGPHSYGGDDARFGASRPGHVHQGQDLMAAEGTPVLAPLGGTVVHRAYQASGAGYYLVVRGSDARDYVFMHCVKGSITLVVDDVVAQGQQVCAVGSTGRSSGPHLHFEIWVGGWQVKGGQPIDPLPDLKAWDTTA